MKKIFALLIAALSVAFVTCGDETTDNVNDWFLAPESSVDGTTVSLTCLTRFGDGVLEGLGAETTSERISKIIPGFLLHIVLYERLCSTILWNTTFITRGTYRGHLDSISRIQGGCNLDGSAHLHRWGTGFRHHRVSMHEPEAAYVQTAGHSGRNAIAASRKGQALRRLSLS